MNTDLETIKNTLIGISKGESLLDTLMEFERTLDNLEVFAYKNWILGELVKGPEISRYWYKTTWMYPYKMMPDPDAGLRLISIGAEVDFRKGKFNRPKKIKSPNSWSDPNSKKAQLESLDVWLVTINLPIKYINRGLENLDTVIDADIARAQMDIADAMGQSDETLTLDSPGDEMPDDISK